MYELQFYGRASAQTNIIHSAANDTIYMMKDGSPLVLTTTNSNGIGTLDFTQFDDGVTYKLYSSVAKDPNNLSNDYSKDIRITKNKYGCTTEAYLMPDAVKTLYWYGNMDPDAEIMSTSNGWSNGVYNFSNPTFNTNDIYLSPTGSDYPASGIAFKDAITANKIFIVGKGVSVNSGFGCHLRTEKVTTSDSHSAILTGGNVLNMAKKELSNPFTGYFDFSAGRGTTCNINAAWYE